jgi:LPS export ABC transporter protein LptC
VNSNQKAILLLVVLLVIATSWFFRKQESAGETAAVAGHGPDAYADNVTIRVMDTAGKPVYRLRAGHIAWYPDSNRLTLTKPQLDVTRPDGVRWRLNADQGRTGRTADPIWLDGNVIIHRLASSSQNPLKIMTADVMVRPDARLALTQQAARVIGTGYQIEAQGLTADFGDNRLELRSRVRGRIDGQS